MDPHRVDVLVNRLPTKAPKHGMTVPMHAVHGATHALSSHVAVATNWLDVHASVSQPFWPDPSGGDAIIGRQRLLAVAPAFALSCIATAAHAADDTWHHTMAAYLIGASIDGTAGVGDVTVDVDVGFDEILDHLDFGFMGAYRAERGPWAVGVDVIYMDLGGQGTGLGPSGRTKADVDFNQLIVETDLFYALTEGLEVVGGLRGWDVDMDVRIHAADPIGPVVEAGVGEQWIDPVIGVRYELPLAEDWTLSMRGDIGGFGVGSEFTWAATAYAAWSFNEHGKLLLGFRYLDVDYDQGQGEHRFVMDLSEGGPATGVAWSF